MRHYMIQDMAKKISLNAMVDYIPVEADLWRPAGEKKLSTEELTALRCEVSSHMLARLDDGLVLQRVSMALDKLGYKTEADVLLQMIDMEPEEIEHRWEYGIEHEGCGSAEGED